MDTLETIWDYTGQFFNGILRAFERTVTSIFGTSNAQYVKKLQGKVAAINALEEKFQALSNDELREQTAKFRQRLARGETVDDLLVEAFAVCREGGKRWLKMRHYDVQLIGGMVLHGGNIAEMITGEGKTLVATLPAYLNALEGKGVHVVTVNDYLARRDMEWMGPLYLGLGLTVGAIQSDMSVLERQKAYSCDITYGTNNEFGFDYLRDNMRPAARGDERFPKQLQQSQGRLNFAIIDEVDNILIDEARTPLIISGPAFDDPRRFAEADRIARQLKKDLHFVVNEKDHTNNLTAEGVRHAEKLAGVESFYTVGNMEWPHLIDNALKAHHLYKRDVNYVVEDGKIVIIDEFTGRKMEGRQWSDGLHQAVEAKEGVKIKEETQTLATITLQNFFRLYKKICGMTGTAMTEASEFWKIYKLDVVAIPPNRKLQRVEHPDVIYGTEKEKFTALADEIERLNKYDALWLKAKDAEPIVGLIQNENDVEVTIVPHGEKQAAKVARDKIESIERRGRPVLVGTVSIEKSERLSDMLSRRGIEHQVLNAKHHRREAEIIAQAGRIRAVTIATNMAGRGTDIILGGNPETAAWAILQHKYATRLDVPRDEWETLVKEIEQRDNMKAMGDEVKRLGGLHVIGTERHDARRIDLQLRGRCGRQGDPGSSRFYLSLEDDLMRRMAGPWVRKFLEMAGLKDGQAIESHMVSRRIAAVQKKVEERNFDVRKSLLEYDEVMDEQRKRTYRQRQDILDGVNCREVILRMMREQIDQQLDSFLHPLFGADTFAKWAGSAVSAPLEGRLFRGLAFDQAEALAKDEAERAAEIDIQAKIDECLPDASPGDGDEDEKPEDVERDWNWHDLARFANTRWKLNFRDHELRREGKHKVFELMFARAREAIQRVDLSEGAPSLADDHGLRRAVQWLEMRFGVRVDPQEAKRWEREEFKTRANALAVAEYDRKEAQCPVLLLLHKHSTRGPDTQINRETLAEDAARRFERVIHPGELRGKQRDEIVAAVMELSQAHQAQAREARQAVRQRLQAFFGGAAAAGRPAAKKAGAAPVERDASDRATVESATGGNGKLASLTDWMAQTAHLQLPAEELLKLDQEQLERKLLAAIEDHYHPEMRRLERLVLLETVDSAWKEHLLTMDFLRSSVGMRGYAQLDPKVEYKREGMRLFNEMWKSIAERTIERMFRLEHSDREEVRATFSETSARHEEYVNSEIGQQQQQAIAASQTDAKPEPFRNKGVRVGRNDPCPCGSGKKFKNCHMRVT